jgi:hypothetical protein
MTKRPRRLGPSTPPWMWIWYVEADASSNSLIARKYSEEEHAHEGILCADGKRRDLWQLPIEFIDNLQHHISTMRLSARLKLHYDWGDGKIRPYTEKRLSTFDESLLAS